MKHIALLVSFSCVVLHNGSHNMKLIVILIIQHLYSAIGSYWDTEALE